MHDYTELSKLVDLKKRRILLGNFRQIFLIGIINALILATLLYDSATFPFLAAWLVAVFALTAIRGLTLRRLSAHDGLLSEKALRWYIWQTFVTGLVWGAIPFLLQPDAPPVAFHIIIFMVAGTTAGAAVAYAPSPGAVTAFNLPVLGLLGLYYVWNGTSYELVMAGVLMLYFFATKILAYHFERTFTETLETNAFLEQARQTMESQAARLKELASQHAAAAQKAEGVAEAKSVFLANMSHELRTPMNAIIGFAEMMDKGVFGEIDNKTYAVYVEHILQSARHLLTIINQILDFARLQSGKVTLAQQPFDLKKAVRTAVASLAPIAKKKNIELRSVIDDKVTDRVIGDEHRLVQVLFNLIGNAVKFTERGHVEVRLQDVAHDAHSCHVRLVVADTGIGIKQEDLKRLFRRFEQAHATNQPTGGTGLGLAISQELIKLMGGEIWVDSTPGKGSEFRIDLEFKLPEAEERPSKALGTSAPNQMPAVQNSPRHPVQVTDA